MSEALQRTLDEHGRLLKGAAESWNKSLNEFAEKQREFGIRLLELEQKGAGRAPGSGLMGGAGELAELAECLMQSSGTKAFLAGNTPTFSISVPARLLNVKNTIINQVGSGQTLVPSDRGPDSIVTAPQRRLTIRGLFVSIPTASNLIERPSEATYTNNAGVQGGDASPTGSGEGSLKNESDMTFTLAQTPVVTIAHFIRASRQILSDSPLLQMHLTNRLLYGLNLEEEDEFLTGDGTAGTVSGINTKANAFTGGSTNQTRLDTLAKAANQLALSSYEPSGFILNPVDWLDCQLEKDTTGRYILGDPGAASTPRLWGLPVVPTPAQTQGKFTVLDAQRYGYIADREDAVVRISENVNDSFLRNLIHLLAEKRTTLVPELGAAAVYGNITTSG